MTEREFEAVLNGNAINTIDPVVRIVIDNGFHQYELKPEDVQRIDIRARANKDTQA